MIENRIIVDKFALAEQFNKETLDIVNSILRKKYSYEDIYGDDIPEDLDDLDDLDIIDDFGIEEDNIDEDSTEEIENEGNDIEHYQVITNFDDYDRHDINDILDGLKPKKYKLELGKSIVLLKHTEMFYLTLNRKAFTFLKYFTETYGK